MFVRVLEVVPDKRLVRVTVNEFGSEHLNASGGNATWMPFAW